MSLPGPKSDLALRASALAGLAALLLTALLTLLAYRGTRLIGFDPHYYLEYAKQFRTEFPSSFGTHWPFGFPLLGTALSRLGFSAFTSQLLINCLGWAALGALLWRPLLATLHSTRVALTLLLILSTTSVCIIELGALRSEIVFTALSTAALVALAESDSPRAWLAAAVAVVLGFCLRYAGILGFAALALWFLHREKWPWFRGPAARKIAILTVAVAACLGLMAWNVATRGYASGAARSAGPGLAGLGDTLSELGWSSLVAFTTIGVRHVFDRSPLNLVIGWLALAPIAVLAIRAWLRPATIYSRPFALGLGVYLGGMVALATTRNFDPLGSGRTFIPALPLVFILAVEPWRAHPRRLVLAGLLLVTLPGLLVAARGVSPQIAPDFSPALRALAPRLAPVDSVGVNLPAIGLSAWLDQPVTRIDDSPTPFTAHRWLVLSADLGEGRTAIPTWPPATAQLLATLAAGREFELVFQNSQLTVWRRRAFPPSP